jgi:hypothetical protein
MSAADSVPGGAGIQLSALCPRIRGQNDYPVIANIIRGLADMGLAVGTSRPDQTLARVAQKAVAIASRSPMSGDVDDDSPSLAMAACSLASMRPGCFSQDELDAAREIAKMYDCAKHVRYMGGGPKIVRSLGAVLEDAPSLEDKLRANYNNLRTARSDGSDGASEGQPGEELTRAANALLVYLMSVEKDPIAAGISEEDEELNPYNHCSKPIQDLAGPAGDADEMMATAQSRPAYKFAIDQALQDIDLVKRQLEQQPAGDLPPDVPGPDVVAPASGEDDTRVDPLGEITSIKDLISKLVDAQMEVAAAAKSVSERYAEIGRLRMLELIGRLSQQQLESFGRQAANIPFTGDAQAITALASALVNVLNLSTATDLLQAYTAQGRSI